MAAIYSSEKRPSKTCMLRRQPPVPRSQVGPTARYVNHVGRAAVQEKQTIRLEKLYLPHLHVWVPRETRSVKLIAPVQRIQRVCMRTHMAKTEHMQP